jgi:hypothetical protein
MSDALLLLALSLTFTSPAWAYALLLWLGGRHD